MQLPAKSAFRLAVGFLSGSPVNLDAAEKQALIELARIVPEVARGDVWPVE